jgi:hypothetical protein
MRTRPSLAASCIIVLAVIVLAAYAGATDHRLIESFNTNQYCDKINTTALWDTVAGELKLAPFTITLKGTYNTAGNARGVAIDGNYAYVADHSAGLQIINITNPASPTLAATYDTPGYARNVAIDGNYAYVADYATGLVVINIMNPASPTLAGTYDTPGSARDVAVDGNYAYVADYSSGLIVVNITNPASPTLAGSYDTPGTALGVKIAGNYAYVADGTSGLQVINITNPASPTLAGTYDTPGSAYDVAIAGNYAYVADYGSGLQVINITTPSSPTLAGSLATPDYAFSVAVCGEYAYIADQQSGMIEVNISNPAHPSIMDSYDTPGYAYDVAIAGNHAFVADDGWGLQVLNVSDQLNPLLVGSSYTWPQCHSVAIDGDYAYLGVNTTYFEVLNISSPAGPYIVGDNSSVPYCYDVAVAGDYAYVADATNGLRVLNISNPDDPTVVGTYSTSMDSRGVAVAGDYAYVGDYNSSFKVINISNAASPSLAGSCALPDICMRGGVVVAGDYAYVANQASGLQVINIGNPSSPTIAGSYNTPGSAYDVAIDGDYAYVADGGSGLIVINVTNPASPTLTGSYNTAGNAESVAISGDYVYVADGSSGLVVFNISNPASPAQIRTYPGTFHGAAVEGDLVFALGSWCRILQVYQRLVVPAGNRGQSLVIDPTHGEIAKVRTIAAQSDSIKWEASANNGANWFEVPPNGTWTSASVVGTNLLWRSTHVYSRYLVNPTCSQLDINWLYQFAAIDSIRDIPGDQGGQVRIYFSRSGYDFSDEATHPISSYYIWRRIDNPAALQEIQENADASSRSANRIETLSGVSDPMAPAGLPIVKWKDRLIQRGGMSPLSMDFPPGTWEIVGSAPGAQLDQYVNVAPTLADSSASGTPYSVYLITAHTTTPSVWYVGPADSGYSVDNLAPHVPTGFAVAYNSGGGNDLGWDACPDRDFEYFKVYRGESADFVPASGNLVQMTIDVGWLDTVEDGWKYYYKITAVDHAGNESAPASPGTVTGTEPPAMPKTFVLYQNVPNPFNPMTRIRFDLPEGAMVRLVVYNVNGQMIRVLANSEMAAGSREVVWDGRDASGRGTASGIYFYRIDAGRFTETRKMILLR